LGQFTYNEEKREIRDELLQARRKQRNARAARRLALLFFAVAAAFSLIIHSYVQLNELGLKETQLQKELNALRSEAEILSIRLERKIDLAQIEEMAKNDLGMSKIEPYQIEYVSLGGGDKVEVLRSGGVESKMQNMLSDIIRSFNAALEYLR